MATTPKPPRLGPAPTHLTRELQAAPAAADDDDSNEPLDDDFHFVLGELLNAYKPVLSADLQRAESPDTLIKDALANPPSCEDEFNQALALFERFGSEDVAQRLLPVEVREQLGSVERWRWCLLHLRCCIVFGWLMCRGPRTFRGSSYYLYRYWRCVREVLGAPVANPPTAAERADFNQLVKALAEAYKPYLDDQLANVEFAQGLPEQVLSGQVDCFEDGDVNTRILERLLSTDTAAALMGRELIAKHRADPLFWFCRCWALCAIRFGCCLARSRNLRDVFRCLRSYRACLRRCQRPLHCALTAPTSCVRGYTDILAGRILEPVRGDAEGTGFGHYLIEVRSPGGTLLSGVVIYPNNLALPDVATTQGNFSVSGGNLGWVDTRKCAVDAGIELLTSTTFALTLRVFSATGAELQPPCTGSFSLSVNEVYIKRVSTPWSVDYPDPAEPLRAADSAAAALSTVGGYLHVRGAANIYGCFSEKISEYKIWARYDPTFSLPQPAPFSSFSGVGWTQVTHIEFNPMSVPQPSGPPINYTADQVRSSNVLDGDPTPSVLTNVWSARSECIGVPIDSTVFYICWNVPSLDPVMFNTGLLPTPPDPAHQPGTGKFSFLLQVFDTAGNTYYDIQRVWVDNEDVKAAIVGIGNQAPCSDMYTQTPEGVFKTVDIRGYAWDEYIDRNDLTAPTSNNFDSYQVRFLKQGAVSPAVVLISSTNTVPPRAVFPAPAESLATGTLTPWNLQVLDAASNPLGLPADQLLGPGEACVYNVILEAHDKTIVNEGDVHHGPGWVLFPIKIINGPEPV